MVTITVCMGSSCFSRGNALNAEVIQRFIDEHRLNDSVAVRGCLCDGKCKDGPNIRINGKPFTCVSPENLDQLLERELDCGGGK